MKKHKKGAVAIQFSWIFVILIGTVIIITTFSVYSAIKRSIDGKFSYTASNYIAETLSNVKKNEKYEYSFALHGLSIEVDSDEDFCNYFSVKDSGLEGKSIEHMPLFSPNILKESVLTYAESIEFPFKSNYVLYLTSPRVAYVFVTSGGDSVDMLANNLPTDINSEKKDDSEFFVNYHNYKVRFVSEHDPEKIDMTVSRLPDRDVTFMKVYPAEKKVEFYQKNGYDEDAFSDKKMTGIAYYNNDVTLIAILYSESAQSYSCNMKKVMDRLSIQSVVLARRLQLVTVGLSLYCQDKLSVYEDTLLQLDNLKTATENVLQIDSALLSSVDSISQSIKNNNKLVIEAGCPEIY
ncbi:MAG: hypothetical protein KKF44_11690 [Nanoarchaeota archaeon]|nr:hypothetical protein [Nanoarchaeota archaeon]